MERSVAPTDWNTTPEDEAKQADYVAQFYYDPIQPSLLLRAITWWDFSDSNAWLNAPSGLVRKDMTPKPAYTAADEFDPQTQWWTDTTGKTDRKGVSASRVFYGDYRITVTDSKGRTATQTVTFPEAAPPLTVTVRLDIPGR